MKLEEAKRELDGINIQAFLSASYEQNTYIVNKADKVTRAIETILAELDRLQKENEELSCVKKAIKVYKTNVGTENCQFVLMSESEFLNSFNYKCLLDDYISKDKVKDCLDDIEDYFERVSVPYEDIEFIKEKRKDLLKEE